MNILYVLYLKSVNPVNPIRMRLTRGSSPLCMILKKIIIFVADK